MTTHAIVCADVIEWAKSYDGPKFHALLCDPPYELGFMGKNWDKSGIAFKPETWAALARHLHPGAFGMAFASSRGWHRLAVAIEDAGLRIHPSIFGWVYGSGFPKATRIDTQVDKAAGAERKVVGFLKDTDGRVRSAEPSASNPNWGGKHGGGLKTAIRFETAPATDLARAWQGHRYGLQAMKPALEPIIVFQKPYQGKPVDCITETGAGALWVDGGRIGTHNYTQEQWSKKGLARVTGNTYGVHKPSDTPLPQGRWPANFTLTHHPECNDGCHPDCPVRKLGEQGGISKSNIRPPTGKDERGIPGYVIRRQDTQTRGHNDEGSCARFFHQSDWSHEIAERLAVADPVRYQAKASRKERDAGLEGRNKHPTIKPIALTRWLATLLLPPPEYAPRHILIPFSGTGSEGIGAVLAGWEDLTLIEMDAETNAIAEARLAYWLKRPEQPNLF